MTNLLLERRSPVNAADIEGYTPLHHAIAEGHGTWDLITMQRWKNLIDGHEPPRLGSENAPHFVERGGYRIGHNVLMFMAPHRRRGSRTSETRRRFQHQERTG